MFVRAKKKAEDRYSIQIVQNTRDGKKVKQKILRHVGVARSDDEVNKLKEIAEEFMANIIVAEKENNRQKQLFPLTHKDALLHVRSKKGRKPIKKIEDILPVDKVTLADIVEEKRIIEGVDEVAGSLYDYLYSSKLPNIGKKASQILKDIVLLRMVNPSSKLRSQKILNSEFGKEYSSDSIYRMMDKIYSNIDRIKRITFDNTNALIPGKCNLLLFDVTTLYFETERTDTIREFGYSKDHRFNTVQLVLALAVNEDGLPIGYELFPGNKGEVGTLIEAITKWEENFKIPRVCFIGDRAMMSKSNIELLEEKGYDYIIACKLRSLPKELKEKILSNKKEQSADSDNYTKEYEYLSNRVIVNYSEKRRSKDKHARENLLTKLRSQLGEKGETSKLIKNTGMKRYIVSEKSETKIDESKVCTDELWDGLHGILTNIESESKEELYGRYKNLWKVEESFRINKHTLKMRPIYHYKEERIKSHVAICYISFALLRQLEYRVKLRQRISLVDLIDTLLGVQSSIYIHKNTGDRYRVPGKFSNEAAKVYKAVDLVRCRDACIYI